MDLEKEKDGVLSFSELSELNSQYALILLRYISISFNSVTDNFACFSSANKGLDFCIMLSGLNDPFILAPPFNQYSIKKKSKCQYLFYFIKKKNYPFSKKKLPFFKG